MASKSKSRRKTPWDTKEALTPTQEMLKEHYLKHYADRHPKLLETGEEKLINEYKPRECPFCHSTSFVKRGLTANKVQRYKCADCGRTFTPTTGTIFDDHKIAISEWMEYCLNLFRYVSINADSWNNKNAFTTSKYWLAKLFLTLAGTQDDIILEGRVWLDETYFPLVKSQLKETEDGKKPRGLSTNQICIGVATDGKRVVCLLEGLGKPSQKKSYEAFKDHIAPGSTLVHDKENAHKRLVNELKLISEEYDSRSLKGVDDANNPLDPINDLHDRLKKFLRAHSGFNRDEITGYLDLFAFVKNPPYEMLEKVELVVKLGFEKPKKLTYRGYFGGI